LETAVKKLYEGMFLIDSAEAAKDWEGIIELIKKTLGKADAEIVSIRKWDERALAYTIRKVNRGTYILTYFRADGRKIRDIEREVQLSDRIMRALILKADHLTEEDIARETPAMRTERQGSRSADRSDSSDEAKQQPGKKPESDTADNVSTSQTA
jgi:small subunit ribosomal protein S6